MITQHNAPPAFRPARYAKGLVIATCPPDFGDRKSRAARLAVFLKGRWTNRERGFALSPKKAVELKRLWEAGWDASIYGDRLEPPETI